MAGLSAATCAIHSHAAQHGELHMIHNCDLAVFLRHMSSKPIHEACVRPRFPKGKKVGVTATVNLVPLTARAVEWYRRHTSPASRPHRSPSPHKKLTTGTNVLAVLAVSPSYSAPLRCAGPVYTDAEHSRLLRRTSRGKMLRAKKCACDGHADQM